MARGEFTYDFFDVVSKSGADFADALSRFSRTPCGQRQIDKISHIYDLAHIEARGHLTVGTVDKNRMRGIPLAVDRRNGNFGRIPLTEHQGLAELTAFVFDDRLKVLSHQRSRAGVSASTIVNLINALLQADFELQPIPDRDTLERLRRLKRPRKFIYRIAAPNAPGYFREHAGLLGLGKHVVETGATTIKMELSIARKDEGGFQPDGLLDALRHLASGGDEVETLKLSGDDDDGRPDLIDFIDGRFKMTEEDNDAGDRHTRPERVIACAERAFIRALRYLREYRREHPVHTVAGA